MKKMAVVCMGHGGGVMMDPKNGNTNFALVPDPQYDSAQRLLKSQPFVLIDCGYETFRQLVEWDAIKNLMGIVVTHCHADHTGGLAALGWRLLFVDRKQIPLVYSEEAEQMLKGQLAELGCLNSVLVESLFPFPFKMCPVDSCEQHFASIYSVGEAGNVENALTFSLFQVNHGIPTLPSCGVGVWSGDQRMAVFSGDTAEPVVGDVPIVFHDAQYADRPANNSHVHCPINYLVEVYVGEYGEDSLNRLVVCHIADTAAMVPYERRGVRHAAKGSVFVIDMEQETDHE
jgi:ribonuclease BN (tRNA processing enzyme)